MFLYYTFVLSLYNTCFGFSVIGYFYNECSFYSLVNWAECRIVNNFFERVNLCQAIYFTD